MTTNDVVKLAYAEAPDLMEETAFVLRLLERIEPSHVSEVAGEFQKIAERVCTKTKTADIASGAKDFGMGVGKTLAGVVAVGLGTAIATDLYNASRRGLTKGRNWKRMMEANPELKESDKATVSRHFTSLQRHAPDIAADPLAAGAAVQRLMSQPELRYDQQLRELMDTQKSKMDTTYKPFDKPPKLEFKFEQQQRPQSGGAKPQHTP